MEKQTTCKPCKNSIRAVIMMMLCFLSAVNAYAQNPQTVLGESWTGTNWENTFQSQNTYDSNGYLTSSISQTWAALTEEWENAIQYTYTNNPTGGATEVLIEMWDAETSTWTVFERVTNVLNGANQIVTSTAEIWIGSAWMNISRQTNTYVGGFLSVELLESWDFLESVWVNSSLTTYTNNSNGTPGSSLTQMWDTPGSAWIDSSRSTYSYDVSGSPTVILTETWVAPSGPWQNETQSLFTNNPNGTPGQILIQGWDVATSSWNDAERITFTYEGLGVDEITKNGFAIYPNPASDFINIKSDAGNLRTFSITDQQGRTVQNGTLTDFETSIDISGLSSGIYLFQLGEARKESVKLIKQ